MAPSQLAASEAVLAPAVSSALGAATLRHDVNRTSVTYESLDVADAEGALSGSQIPTENPGIGGFRGEE